jgi:hypothetical protein
MEERVYNGQTYRRAGPGEPWVRVGGGQDQRTATIFTDPNAEAEREAARRAEERENERLRIAQENARLAAIREGRQAQNDAIANEQRLTGMEADAEEQARLKAAQTSGMSDTLYQLRNTIRAATAARDMGAKGDGIGSLEGSEGFQDSMLMSIVGANSDSLDMQGLLNTVGSNTAFDRLQRMREESPTGGALGAVSERELDLLRDTLASLSQRQSPEQFKANLQTVIDAYTRVYAKLDTAERYVRANGSLEGYVPPSDEEIANFRIPDGPAGDEPGAAGAGATQTSIAQPEATQRAFNQYVAQNWGNLNAADLARYMADYEFAEGTSPWTAEGLAGFVERANQDAARGLGPDSVGAIPPTNRDLSESEQARNDLAASEWATGGASFANSLTAGGVGLVAGDQLDMAQQINPKSAFAGDFAGGILGSLGTGGLLKAGASLAGIGGRGAALAANQLVADTVYGGAYGAAEDGVAGALLGAGGAVAGDVAGRAIGGSLARAFGPDDLLLGGERAIVDSGADMDSVAAALMEADSLGVPMMPADASPELASLAGSSIRYSPTQGGAARDVVARRNQGQGDRLLEAIERDLGPVDNIPQRSQRLIDKARRDAGPLYDAAYAAPGAESVDLSDLSNRPTFAAALKEAYNEVLDEGLDPAVMGFVEDSQGNVTVPGLSSRYVDPRGDIPASERAIYNEGMSAPRDLVSFVRESGGLRDSGGELASRDLNNRVRRGVDMAGGDSRAGPLVSDEGRSFDDMAEAAWEAGYFGNPETTPRPTEREFLEALDETVSGANRRFSINDEQTVQEYFAQQQARNEWMRDDGLVEDIAQPVGMEDVPFAPPSAYGEMQGIAPTWQTLDYIKRGLDNVIERGTDAINGVSPDARRAINMRNMLVERMDAGNPDYAAARAAYAGPAQERAMLRQGEDAYKVNPQQLGVDVGRMGPQQVDQMRLGYQSRAANRAGDLRSNSNPWAQLNTPNTEGRLDVLYGEDGNVANLLAQRDLELQLAGSGNRLVGNSLTAEREIADELFRAQPGVGSELAAGMAETALYGGPFITVGKRLGDRFLRDRREAAAAAANTRLADEIGPLLLNDSAPDAVNALSDIYEQDAVFQEALKRALEQGQRVGGAIGSGLGTAGAQSFIGR